MFEHPQPPETPQRREGVPDVIDAPPGLEAELADVESGESAGVLVFVTTGADVAASNDPTGVAALARSWFVSKARACPLGLTPTKRSSPAT